MDLRALSAKLIKGIEDPSKWHDALSALCAYTQTDRALISLRDKKTAEIVIPEDVSTEFASPLIYGFEEEEVAAFLSDFGEVDPWTKIERENHPYFPYQMSRYLSKPALKQTEFWHWLKPMKISECIVCELGETEAYWAALNLYFDPKDDAETTAALELLKDVLPLLKSVWASGRALQVATTAAESLDIILSAIQEPAALVLETGELVATNDRMSAFLKDLGLDSSHGSKIAIPANYVVSYDGPSTKLVLAETSPLKSKGAARVRAYKAAQLKDGESRDTYLLTIDNAPAKLANAEEEVWDQQSLTPRERTLVRLVAKGAKFNEAQLEMGVSYARIMQIWKSARTKLGVKDVNDLRLNHRMRRA